MQLAQFTAVWIDVGTNAKGCMRLGSYGMHIGYLSLIDLEIGLIDLDISLIDLERH